MREYATMRIGEWPSLLVIFDWKISQWDYLLSVRVVFQDAMLSVSYKHRCWEKQNRSHGIMKMYALFDWKICEVMELFNWVRNHSLSKIPS